MPCSASSLPTNINDHVVQFFKNKDDITGEGFVKAIKDCTDDIMILLGVTTLPINRLVIIIYRDLAIQIQVGSISEEVHIAFHASLKGLAVVQNKSESTLAEQVIFDIEKPPTAAVKLEAIIPSSLVRHAAAARAACRDNIIDSGAETADLIQQAMHKCKANILLIDPYFGLKMALCHKITSDKSESLMAKAIMKWMPSEETDMEPEAFARALDRLTNSSLFKLSIRATQSKVKLVQRLVSNIIERTQITFTEDMLTTGILKEAIASLQWFVKSRNKDGTNGIWGRGFDRDRDHMRQQQQHQ